MNLINGRYLGNALKALNKANPPSPSWGPVFPCFISLFASAQESRLTIFSENGDPFYVILNGIRQNEEPVTNIAVDYAENGLEALKTLEQTP